MISDTVDVMHLSVRAERVLKDAGIKTVAELRACDLGRVGLNARYHRRAIARALAEYDAQKAAEAKSRTDRLNQAREAFAILDEGDRKALLAELHAERECTVSPLVALAKKHPAQAVGAVVFGLIGAALMSPGKPKNEKGGA